MKQKRIKNRLFPRRTDLKEFFYHVPCFLNTKNKAQSEIPF